MSCADPQQDRTNLRFDPSEEVGSESGVTLEEVIPDEAALAPDGEAIRGSDREFIESLMSALSPTEQTAIRLRFGLDDGEARTLDEVGQSLGYGRQGVHRLEKSALAKLRARAERVGAKAAAKRPGLEAAAA